MRRAYSTQAVSAHSGSLAARATTCSLATRFFLRRRLCRRARQAYGLAAPDFLEVVKVAHRRMHDMHDHVAEVDEHPFAARFALDAVDPSAVLARLFLHVVRERL